MLEYENKYSKEHVVPHAADLKLILTDFEQGVIRNDFSWEETRMTGTSHIWCNI